MALIDLKTNLNNWKFGVPPASDRPNSGNSGQPYIKNGIDRNVVPQSEDFLLRGGLNAPLDSATDIARLTKFFFDLKSPNGLLFIAKQNLLSRIGVATQASGKLDWKKASLNEGVYTPLNTIAQAGVNFMGSHLFKQGLNPLKGLRTYSDVVKGNGIEDEDTSIVGVENNRLVNFYNNSLVLKDGATIDLNGDYVDPVILFSYAGGPNSDVGIGGTNIKFATNAKGSPLLSTNFYRDNVRQDPGIKPTEYLNGTAGLQYGRVTLDRPPLGVTTRYAELSGGEVTFGENFDDDGNFTGTNLGEVTVFDGNNQELVFLYGDGMLSFSNVISNTVYNPLDPLKSNPSSNSPSKIYGVGLSKTFTTLTQEDIRNIDSILGKEDQFNENFQSIILNDVKNLPEGNSKKISTIMSLSPSYNQSQGLTIEGPAGSRIHQLSPGQKGNILNYSKGKILNYGSPSEQVSVVDQVNYQPLYKSSNVRVDKEVAKNDLIKFRIGAIMRDGEKVYTHFRAFIDSFADNYTGNWDSVNYMGRGESFYKYSGFNRTISLSFTVAAQSKPELMAQYKKLNFIASTLAPDYGKSGYMGGVLTTLTLGAWCYELPGFISSLGLSVPQESPWEIAIPATDEEDDKDNEMFSDRTTKEMPHICKVSMQYTPIHRFRPELQQNDYEGLYDEVSKYGNQHYLGLNNGYNNNYVPVSLKNAQTPGFTPQAHKDNATK